MNKKTKKKLVIGLIIATVSAIMIYQFRGIFALIFIILSMDSSSKDKLVENYQSNKTAIVDLKEEYEKMVPEGFKIYIEFKDENNIDLWVYEKMDSSGEKLTCLFQEWKINPFDYKMEPLTKYDSSIYAPKTKDLELVKAKLQWTDATFIEIKEYLDKANCISIENGNPAEIGFARSGMGKYSYYLFDEPIPENEIDKWNDSCSYIYYNPNVVLGYGGGAFGSQCFPDPD